VEPWRARAEELARTLSQAATKSAPLFDLQRVFAWCPPDSAAGESLFRLAEALPRTRDRGSRLALVRERIPALRSPPLAAISLPFVAGAMNAVGGQFVYAERIDAALARAGRAARRDARRRYSFDMLGEGARSAADARRNLERYLAAAEAAGRAAAHGDAAWRARFGVSIKLSSIHARFDAASYASVRAELLESLRSLCRPAAAADIGLTIDAEESERSPLQLDLLAALAADPEFFPWSGLGVAVQAYRPQALESLEAVLDIARRRIAAGGKSLGVRLVKGAYWDAEIKRAQELGLEQYPVLTDKGMTDLSYVACAKQLLEHSDSVFAQFATHNPVTLGCVLALAGDRPVAFECQRLHGMGEGLDGALRSVRPALPVRVYAPVGGRQELLAYLVRRLLENGASSSYVRQAARAKHPEALLADSFAFLDADMKQAPFPLPMELHMPDRRTARGYDLADPLALASMAKAVAAQPRTWSAAPLVGGKRGEGPGKRVAGPARPDLPIGEVIEATPEGARAAIAIAHAARAGWGATDVARRAATLDRLADLIEADTTRLMALCVWEAGKTLPDALADVREAVDFCRYYAQQARQLFVRPLELRGPTGERNVLSLHGRGVFACISPWNFPVAIFTGQVAAALVAGNPVIAKPAEQTPLTAYRVAELILAAGVPPEVFHLVPGAGESVGRAIVEDPRIAGVVFTGSNQTAGAIQRSLAAREGPLVPLIAETGGLNAMIVDSTALPEQVVDAVLTSAFQSAGQRCSSLRVLYLQNEIAPAVLGMLRGAIEALRLGDPSDPATDVGPLIDAAAQGALAAYVNELRGRARLVAEAGPLPRQGSYVAPVAFEVGSMREVPGERFGPILHVVRFAIEDLDAVIDQINATGFGLTMGIHTRVESRAEHVRARANVGNLYVNRNLIGATVGVQPFGGEGLSGTGPKAGGPHYLTRFATERVYTVNTAAAGGDLGLVTGSAL
jgi:RHH-type proline utilization regulon transcriptional repressor/proline dehydrogenase/delta 1-pyrroline-5-carboxylate dehydrogenase